MSFSILHEGPRKELRADLTELAPEGSERQQLTFDAAVDCAVRLANKLNTAYVKVGIVGHTEETESHGDYVQVRVDTALEPSPAVEAVESGDPT